MRSRLRRPLVPAAAAVVCALALAACGGSNNTSDKTGAGTVTITRTVTSPAPTTTTGGPQTDTTATKTSTTRRAVGTACTAADLTPAYLGSNGAAGTIVLGFALQNTGSSTCHTYGWPGVEFLSASGAPLPTNATRTTGDVVGPTPANVLTLAPGESASFRLVTSDVGAGGGNCPTASALQIYAPDDTVKMRVSVHGVAACGKATLSPMLPGHSALAGQGGGGGGGQAGIGAGGGSGSAGGGSAGGGSAGGGSASGGSGLSGSGE